MRPANELPAVYLCRDIVDFRKGINGLSVLVEEALQHDPFSERLFVFCNRKRDKIKILYCATASVSGRSAWNGQQLNWLLDGYDVMRMQPHERLHFSSVL